MDIETLIKDTFTAHEHDAPDGDAVLAAARRRIARGHSRPLAVAAGVVVLTLAAVAVVALNRPADEDRAAAPESAENTASAKPATTDLRMPFSLGWLPEGDVTYVAHRINIGGTARNHDIPVYGGEYALTVATGGQILHVAVLQLKMVSVDRKNKFKSGPARFVTVGGQRAVESSRADTPIGYELHVAHPGGGTMYVNVAAEPGTTAPTQQLIDVGRRIAENIRFPGTTTVSPSFGLRDLPGGMRICAFDLEHGGGGVRPNMHYSLGTCATLPPIAVSTQSRNEPAGTPGRPVQGHATRHANENGYRTVRVLDAVGGAPVEIGGRVKLADLYAIADRLVLPR